MPDTNLTNNGACLWLVAPGPECERLMGYTGWCALCAGGDAREAGSRFVLPALFASLIATGVPLLVVPNAPTYKIPSFPVSASAVVWAIVTRLLFALADIPYVRLARWADKGKPRGSQRFIAPTVVPRLLE